MPTTQSDKAATFRALHQGPRAFVVANAWDAGSARALAALGFPALATSSGAQAGVLGRRDGRVTRTEALAHARAIVAATDLPVSADLEKGFGDAPAAAAETIRLAAEAGLVGGFIEDATGDTDRPLYDIGQASERGARAAPLPRTGPGLLLAVGASSRWCAADMIVRAAEAATGLHISADPSLGVTAMLGGMIAVVHAGRGAEALRLAGWPAVLAGACSS